MIARVVCGFRFGLSNCKEPCRWLANDFPPRRESELVPFSQNFKTKIALAPTTYGLTALQATSYGTKHDDFVAKWNVCQDPATKTKMAVEAKNASKSVLLDELRMLARVVQNFPGTTDAMRIDLACRCGIGAVAD